MVLAREKGLALNREISPDIPRTLIADPLRLRQILVNLIGNAVKFTDEGSVSVHLTFDFDERGASFHFCIADTGIGISPGQQKQIFEPFVQGDGSVTRRHSGTGLGLAISSQLVESMGGRIWLESKPGAGSKFHFSIPYVSGQRS
jgi:signal transduction histidine kinase